MMKLMVILIALRSLLFCSVAFSESTNNSNEIPSKHNKLNIFVSPNINIYSDAVGYQINMGTITAIGKNLFLRMGLSFYHTPSRYDLYIMSFGGFVSSEYHFYLNKKTSITIFPSIALGFNYGVYGNNNDRVIPMAALTVVPLLGINFPAWDETTLEIKAGYNFIISGKVIIGFLFGVTMNF